MISAVCLALAVLLLPGRRVAAAGPMVREVPALDTTPGTGETQGRWASLMSGVTGRKRRARAAAVDAVLDVLDVAAAALRAGQSPEAALRYAVAATSSGPWAPMGLSALGSDVVAEFERWASVHGIPALGYVTRAWRVAAETGAPLAHAVEVGAALLRHTRDHERALAVAFAGPRATIRLLSALPLGGPVVGWALGLDPVAMYLGSPVGLVCVCVGLGLVLVGRVWCRRMLERAMGAGSS